MHYLFLNWKDSAHPQTGGAEAVTHAIAEAMVQDGHQVTLFTSSFPGAKPIDEKNGVTILRKGGRYSVYLYAMLHYILHRAQYDAVFDFINTIPFFTPLFVAKRKRFSLIHQLCREIWFYEFPRPVAWMGQRVENLLLKLYKQERVFVPGNSTKRDLVALGFDASGIEFFPEGIDIRPLSNVPQKNEHLTMLYTGRLSPQKRVEDVIYAFYIVKERYPDAELHIVGDGPDDYKNFLHSLQVDGITFHGRVSAEKKQQLMQSSHALCVASVREGWGLVVTEANALGTPAIVYNSPGLCDSTEHMVNGVLCKENTPEELANNFTRLLEDANQYNVICKNALVHAGRFSWKRTGEFFISHLTAGVGQ